MKTLITVNSKFEADSIVTLLASHNIKSYSTSRGAGSYFNIIFNTSTFGEDIKVNENDFEKAEKILEEYKQETPNDPEMQRSVDKVIVRRKIFSIIIILILAIYLTFSVLQSIFF